MDYSHELNDLQPFP